MCAACVSAVSHSWGVILIGKYFFAKTFVGFVVYTIGLSYFEKIPFELNTEHFIAVAIGGAILGVGLSLILRNGGCIDGSEIFANIIVKKDLQSFRKGLQYFLHIDRI